MKSRTHARAARVVKPWLMRSRTGPCRAARRARTPPGEGEGRGAAKAQRAGDHSLLYVVLYDMNARPPSGHSRMLSTVPPMDLAARQ